MLPCRGRVIPWSAIGLGMRSLAFGLYSHSLMHVEFEPLLQEEESFYARQYPRTRMRHTARRRMRRIFVFSCGAGCAGETSAARWRTTSTSGACEGRSGLYVQE